MDRQVALVLLAACGGGGGDPAPDACAPAVLYLDRAGGAWDHGARDNAALRRSVLVDAPRTVAPWPKDETDWQLLVPCLKTGLLPFALTVTEVDPSPAPHTTIVFTDAYWAGSIATTSVIPDSCRDDHQVEFVFGDALATRARSCHVALRAYAQMVANLSFADNCMDFVNDQMDCVPDRMFLDETEACIDAGGATTQCRCGGTTQNSFQALTAAIPACR